MLSNAWPSAVTPSKTSTTPPATINAAPMRYPTAILVMSPEPEAISIKAPNRAPPAAPIQNEPLVTVDPAAVLGRDQFVDRGVHRRILPADARPGQEPAGGIPHGVGGEPGQHGGDDVKHQSQDEQLVAAEPVGQLADDQCAQTAPAT
jgi:hypothetical protein